MKKLILIFITAISALQLRAQMTDPQMNTVPARKQYTHDSLLSRWVLDINLLGGLYNRDFTTAASADNYPRSVNTTPGSLSFKNGSSFGGDAQLGFFFGHKRHWGIGTGFMYLYQQGDVTLNGFHAEYQAVDANGVTFRQVVTGDQVKEHITSSNMDIPLVLKYKNRFSKRIGFTADAGLLFNVQMKNMYKSSSSFDYEGIYAYNNEHAAVYDPSPVPSVNDVLFTKANFLAHNPNGDVNAYFNSLHNQGFGVGLGVNANNTKGTVTYKTFSVGLLFQPSINVFLSDVTALNFGLYYLYQPFKSSAETGYQLTSRAGDYNSVLNNVTADKTQSYGLNVGVRFFLGKSKPPMRITSEDSTAPTMCGVCDGSIKLHGLIPGKPVVVNYNFNGVSQPAFTGTVDANGNVTFGGLCAGSYTGIIATIGRHNAAGTNEVIVAPTLIVASQGSSNPTANGKCDGTITFNGLYAGRPVAISYNLNGTPQPPYSGIVNSDNTVTITGLCEGAYSGMVVNINGCTANATDITLTAPPPPPPPAVPPAPQQLDISTPILFDFNKITVHRNSLPVLEAAAEEMKENKRAVIVVDAYTDAVGSKAYNQRLSVKRANSVKSNLKRLGVNPKRVKTVGHGKNNPAASNDTPEGRAENRRAVMKMK